MSVAIVRIASIMGLLAAAGGFAVIGGYLGLFLSGSIGFILVYVVVMTFWISRGAVSAERLVLQQQILAGDQVEVTITISLPARYWLCWMVVEERWVQQKNSSVKHSYEAATEEAAKASNPTKAAKAAEAANPTKEQEDLAEHYACLVYIRGSRSITCQYTTSAKARGLYRVHSSRVMIGDMFGLVKRVLIQEEVDAEIVQVNPVPLSGGWINRLRLIERTPTDYGTLRNYTSGDPISSIDWKSYARYQELMTKQLEVEESQSMLIVLDARKAHFETIVSAATRIVMEMNEPTLELILACGESECSIIPHNSEQNALFSEIYEWLATIEALSTNSFAEQLRSAIARSGSCSIEGRAVIGLTAAPDERREHIDNIQQQSIQLVYLPPADYGAFSYA